MKCSILSVSAVVLCLASLTLAADKAPPIKWAGVDINSAAVNVPAQKPSVVAFLRGDQAQSQEELKLLKSTIKDKTNAQILVILSGPNADMQIKTLAGDIPAGWLVVPDREFSASGIMNIHVWPTTLVIDTNGVQQAHLAGLSRNFAGDLEAHLAFATGEIDAVTLSKRLAAKEVITDGPRERAARHAQVCEQLLLKGMVTQARSEIDEGIKLQPQEPVIKLALARVLLAESKPLDAMNSLDSIPPQAIPAWRLGVVRLRVLIGLEKWADAKVLVGEVTKLNPDPSEAYYLSGLVWQHEKDWPRSSEAFRAAYEASQSPLAKP